MTNEDLIAVLNTLHDTCRDGERGFRSCATKVESRELRRVFEQRAAECAAAAREIQAELECRGAGCTDEAGTAAGALHRGWVAARSVLARNDDLAMLEECERGEDAALERYRAALAEPLPDGIRLLVDRQYQGVKRNHAQIRQMRNQARAAAHH